jgi:hypothetical protein
MYSPIWSRLRAVLAVLCLTLAPLATASADPKGIPIRGTLTFEDRNIWAVGTLTGLGPVTAEFRTAGELVILTFTMRSGDQLVASSAPIGRNPWRIFRGTGRFEGADGTLYLLWAWNNGRRTANVEGFLVLAP